MCFGDGMKKREQRDKASKFIELANKRVNRTLKNLRLISNLSNKNNYEHSDEQAKKILRTLQKEIDLVKANFNNKGQSEKGDFKL